MPDAAELPAPSSASLRRRLLAWFARRKRALPWRATRDAYAIWISEAMLQQTRVETAIPFWERFLAQLPDVHSLARAPRERVLALWSGLGYYRRAAHLHEAARAIVERHAGQFPRILKEARALPGVGPYTAGAVLSIAYGAPEAVVDGNVARVLARWFAIEQPIDSSAGRAELWRLARLLVPTDGRAGDWNQALMELGATLCTPREPRCGECPVATSCRARAAGRSADLPRTKPRRAARDVRLEMLWIERRGEVLLQRAPEGRRMAGLWELPTREVRGADGALCGLFPERWPTGVGAGQGALVERCELRHAITHHRIRARVLQARASRASRLPAGCAWHPLRTVDELALTGLTRKACASGPRAEQDSRLGPGSLPRPARRPSREREGHDGRPCGD